MRGASLPSSPSRIKGRASLLRRLRTLLIAANRYGQHRAVSRDDLAFAGALVDGLSAVLGHVDRAARVDNCTPSPTAATAAMGGS